MTKQSLLTNKMLTLLLLLAFSTAALVLQRRYEDMRLADLRREIRRELEEELTLRIEALVHREVARRFDQKWALLSAPKLPDVAKGAAVLSDHHLDAQIAGSGVPEPAAPEHIELAKVEVTPLTEDAPPEQTPPPRPQSIERTMEQKGSVLLPKGSLILEPSLTYAHFSTNRLHIQGVTILDVFTIGPINTQKIQRDVLIQTTSLKYGLTSNLQGELRVPARYEFDRTSNTDQTIEDTRSKGGLGDIEMSLSRQIGWEDGWKPDLIASLGVKTITGEPIYDNKIALGTGHWSVRTSLIAAKSSDPVVIFSSLSYIYNFERHFDGFGDVKPGDTVAYSLGLAIALSYQTAINFSFDQSFSQRLKRDGEKVTGSFVNAANFKTGLNWAVNDTLSVDVSVAAGLTEDSPDLTVEVRFPMRF